MVLCLSLSRGLLAAVIEKFSCVSPESLSLRIRINQCKDTLEIRHGLLLSVQPVEREAHTEIPVGVLFFYRAF